MRATIEFISHCFSRFNSDIFSNELPVPLMHVSSARSFMGQFKVRRALGISGRWESTYHITISNRYDLEEKELEDIIIHEMIHFYLHYKNVRDISSHGPRFKTLMNEINIRFNRKITVSHRCSKEQLESDTSKSHSIVCLCTMTDGRRLVCRVSNSKVFEIHAAFQTWDKVSHEEWYWVYGNYFNRYRRVLTPKLFPVDEEGLSVISDGVRLEFSVVSGGRMILRPARPTLR